MIYVRVKAHATSSALDYPLYAEALVNGWIDRADVESAVSVARRMIAERGWYSEDVEVARFCDWEDFPDDAKQYFDQALTDREVLVFYTTPRATASD
jgi:hypothetical protein